MTSYRFESNCPYARLPDSFIGMRANQTNSSWIQHFFADFHALEIIWAVASSYRNAFANWIKMNQAKINESWWTMETYGNLCQSFTLLETSKRTTVLKRLEERVRERCEALGRVSTAVLNGVQRLEQRARDRDSALALLFSNKNCKILQVKIINLKCGNPNYSKLE